MKYKDFKVMSQNEMKNVKGGSVPFCTPGTTHTGYSGGGVPGGCKLDLLVCDQDCNCTPFCDIPYDDDFCDNYSTYFPS